MNDPVNNPPIVILRDFTHPYGGRGVAYYDGVAQLNNYPARVAYIRNPRNTDDGNAIRILVPTNHRMVGHLRRSLVVPLAAMMDSNMGLVIKIFILAPPDYDQGDPTVPVRIRIYGANADRAQLDTLIQNHGQWRLTLNAENNGHGNDGGDGGGDGNNNNDD